MDGLVLSDFWVDTWASSTFVALPYYQNFSLWSWEGGKQRDDHQKGVNHSAGSHFSAPPHSVERQVCSEPLQHSKISSLNSITHSIKKTKKCLWPLHTSVCRAANLTLFPREGNYLDLEKCNRQYKLGWTAIFTKGGGLAFKSKTWIDMDLFSPTYTSLYFRPENRAADCSLFNFMMIKSDRLLSQCQMRP